MGIKKGTRLTDNPKNMELKFRYDAQTAMKLETICAEKKKTKSQVIRDGIEKQYAEIQGKKDGY